MRIISWLVRLVVLILLLAGINALWSGFKTGSWLPEWLGGEDKVETMHTVVLQEISSMGKLEVVKVKDVAADELRDPDVPEKIVKVKDERGRQTEHRLIQDPETKKWVVDEILITQTLKGVKATRTISEQVAFVRFVNEFSEAWRGGDRDARLVLGAQLYLSGRTERAAEVLRDLTDRKPDPTLAAFLNASRAEE